MFKPAQLRMDCYTLGNIVLIWIILVNATERGP